ncbi:MAG: alcohol dehydrogenase catalytic domain-containing protein, partial [Actinomycetota bacterium]|nr:alcohol dehydrogenase catalytic domain-containing protein [Actinomycetota bacterium]
MRALQVQHNVRRFGAARLLSVTSPKASARVAPVHLRNVDDPPKPAGVGWSKVTTRLAGICGSDLALIDGHASTYFEDFVSFPLIPGQEIIGELESGQRVVIEPVLG